MSTLAALRSNRFRAHWATTLFALVFLKCMVSIGSSQDKDSPPACALVWQFPTHKSLPQAILSDALNRPLLYVALNAGGLAVFDVSEPKRPPVLVGQLSIEHFGGLHVMNLAQSGELLLVALGEFFNIRGAKPGLAVIDVHDPRQPHVIAVWSADEVLKGSSVVVVGGGYAYPGAMNEGIMIFDVSNPERLIRVSVIQPDIHFPVKNPSKVQRPNVRGLVLRDNLLFK